MRVLIAEDDRTTNCMLEQMLFSWGYEVVSPADGNEAWKVLQRDDAPCMVLSDWSMPKLDGVELCRRVRQSSDILLPYIILVTSANKKQNIIEVLQAGADDYVTKPFDPTELRARILVGVRVVGMHHALADRMSQIKQQQGLLPICASCKKIRDDKGYWNQIEGYISKHSEAEFTHSTCPDCMKALYPDLRAEIKPEAT